MQAYRKVPASCFVGTCDDQGGGGGNCQTVSSASPQVFGPVAWNFLHTVAEHYDPDHNPQAKEECTAWLSSTPTMLPCPNCRVHLKDYVKAHPVEGACQSRDALRTYLVDLHNTVNKRLDGDKPWTVDQAKQRYATAELCVD